MKSIFLAAFLYCIYNFHQICFRNAQSNMNKFMRDVISLGKIRKFAADTAMFIICPGAIYFLTHFEICFWRTSFDGANIYRASRAIIPRIMFFEAALFTRAEERVRRDASRRSASRKGTGINWVSVNCREFIKSLWTYVKLFRPLNIPCVKR